MFKHRTGTRHMARLAIVVLAVAALSGLSAVAALANPFVISIDKPLTVVGTTVTMTGTADSPSNAGHHIDIDWGDGSTDTIALDGSGPWVWGPISHTYATTASYTVSATLVHQNEQGNDKSSATDSTVVDVPVCDPNCGTDGSGDGPTNGQTAGTTARP